MLITVKRKVFNDKATIGDFLIDGKKVCNTLEDVVRPDGVKVFGQTAIPYGKYEVVVSMSAHFNKPLPLLVDVPNFAGVRIHSGNTDADTEGCILVGQWDGKASDFIGNSRASFDLVFASIQEALKKEQVFIEIVKG